MADKASRDEQPRAGLLAVPGLRWIGRLPVGRATALFTLAVLLGMIATIVMGQEPGFLLGFCLVAGSVAAAATVRRGRAYAFIPLPAVAYLIASTLAGYVHDSSALTSSKAYVVNFLVWIGGSFVAVTASTVLVVLIALVRWLLGLRLVSGQLPATGAAGTGRAASWSPEGGPRGNRAARDDRDRRGSRAWMANTGPWRSQNRPYDSRESQGSRDDRDPRAERPPGRGPRDSRDPYADRDARDAYDRDPRDNRRPPSPPRDLW
jgi:hypothetical protein